MRLKHWAIQADDARVRRDAVVRLVDLLGGKARPFLLARVADEAESPKVRAACARLLGRAGTLADLEAILDATMPRRIHAGAAAGLVDLGETTPAATYRLEAILRGGCAEQRDAVVNALSAEHSPWKRWLATSLAQDACIPPSSRARLINGLGAQKAKAALPTLERLAVATNEPTEVRVAAARALGILGMPHGREALETIASDAPVALRRASTVALQRLARREQEER